jgi:hypothetical protein
MPPCVAGVVANHIVSGAGIRSGREIDVVENIDVTPTIARLLGVTFNTANGLNSDSGQLLVACGGSKPASALRFGLRAIPLKVMERRFEFEIGPPMLSDD